MSPETRRALARVQVAEVIRRMVPYLHAAGQHNAVSVMLNHATDVADQIVADPEAAMNQVDPLGEALNSGDGSYRP